MCLYNIFNGFLVFLGIYLYFLFKFRGFIVCSFLLIFLFVFEVGEFEFGCVFERLVGEVELCSVVEYSLYYWN